LATARSLAGQQFPKSPENEAAAAFLANLLSAQPEDDARWTVQEQTGMASGRPFAKRTSRFGISGADGTLPQWAAGD
jgi:hypothetical protein